MQPGRSLAHTPVFQVMFALQNAPATQSHAELPGVALKSLQGDSASAMFDLTLNLTEAGGRLTGAVNYNTDLFDCQSVARMAAHLRALLEAAAADPDESLGALPLLGEGERRELLGWSGAGRARPAPAPCAHQLFERQAARAPSATAIASGEEELTYGALNARANMLARHLRGLGVGPETVVGLLADRSAEFVVAVLGILKAGGAYLPLDPQLPAGRLGYMMEDAGARLLVAQQHLMESATQIGADVFCIEAEREAVSRQSDENLESLTGQENLAYVIYTSGSTGEPKGVMATHGGLSNLAAAQARAFGVGEGQRLLQFASAGFDASVSELFVALHAGATLYMAPRHALLRSHRIEVVTLPPSALAVMPEDEFPDLRTLVVAGETCPAALAERWSRGRLFINAYGPTEATVCATLGEWAGEGGRTPPIGRPLENTELYVLDAEMGVAPLGVMGELYVGGAGVTRGYMGRAGLTAERYVPNPFGGEPGGRLYRTGDRGRYLPGGEVEFLGRRDDQVKLRGYRIELGEIEAALNGHPAAREAAVLLREDQPGERRLVAYVRTGETEAAEAGGEVPPVSAADWRAYLGERLPEYMLPSAYVELGEFPRIASGKVNRRALPAPARAAAGADYVAPRDMLEARLARLWEEVLGVERVGVRDSFFDLGGHSLLATRLMARVEEVFGRQLPLTALFRSPTVEQMCGLLREQGAEAGEFDTLVEIQAGEAGRRAVYFVHPSGGSVLSYAELATHLGQQQPVYAFQSAGLERGGRPHTSVTQMAAHYVERLKRQQPEGPYVLGGWSMGGVVAFEMTRQLEEQGGQVERLLLLDVPAPSSRGVVRSLLRSLSSAWELFDPKDPLTLLQAFGRELNLSLAELSADREQLGRLAPEEQLSYVVESAKQSGLLPPHFDAEHLQQPFRVFRANVEALRAYSAEPYAGRVTLFVADERFLKATENPLAGWEKLVGEGLEVEATPGDHFTMLRKPHVKTLATKLGAYLAGARQG